MGKKKGKNRTRLGKDVRRLHVADVDPLPDPVPSGVLLPTFELVAPHHVRAVRFVHEVE